MYTFTLSVWHRCLYYIRHFWNCPVGSQKWTITRGFSISFFYFIFACVFSSGYRKISIARKRWHWNETLQSFPRDLSGHELLVQNFSQHLSLDCISTSDIYLSPFFSNRTILKVAERRELLSVPTGFVSSPWALNQGGRNKRPGPFFSGTVGTCALVQWQKAAKEILGTFWGSATFFTQNKQSEIFHQGILQAHYPTWWRPVGIP